jgi:hypothetical protein
MVEEKSGYNSVNYLCVRCNTGLSFDRLDLIVFGDRFLMFEIVLRPFF